MTSVSLYTIIAVTLISILLLVSSANKRLQSNEHAVNNLIVSIEDIKRDIKLGTNFRCDTAGSSLAVVSEFIIDNSNPQSASVITRDCPAYVSNIDNTYKGGNSRLTFRSDINTFTSYYMVISGNYGWIERKIYDTNGNYIDRYRVTTDDIQVTTANFYVEGTDQADSRQPIIIMKVTGINKKSDSRGAVNRPFVIETAITPIGIDG